MTADLNRSLFMLRNGLLYKSCPSCSVAYGKDVFYNCPEYFGYRHDDAGRPYSQSLCMKCRGHSPSSSVLPKGSTLFEDSDIIVPEIRVLPLSSQIFNSYDKVIEFFLKEMPLRGNTYYYKSHNLVASKNTLVLFQYSGNIIGYAFYEDEADIDEVDPKYSEGYRGYYVFAKNSIKILSSPINSDTMFEKFSIKLSQATSKMRLAYFPVLMELFDEGCDDEIEEENKHINEKTILNLLDYIRFFHNIDYKLKRSHSFCIRQNLQQNRIS